MPPRSALKQSAQAVSAKRSTRSSPPNAVNPVAAVQAVAPPSAGAKRTRAVKSAKQPTVAGAMEEEAEEKRLKVDTKNASERIIER